MMSYPAPYCHQLVENKNLNVLLSWFVPISLELDHPLQLSCPWDTLTDQKRDLYIRINTITVRGEKQEQIIRGREG